MLVQNGDKFVAPLTLGDRILQLAQNEPVERAQCEPMEWARNRPVEQTIR